MFVVSEFEPTHRACLHACTIRFAQMVVLMVLIRERTVDSGSFYFPIAPGIFHSCPERSP